MTSIEASNLPLAFPATGIDDRFSGITPGKGQIAVRCLSRAMDGMQKQALVWDSLSKTVWSLACDEGPYLNGTDLAPFPLAHFNTGWHSRFIAKSRHWLQPAACSLASSLLPLIRFILWKDRP